MASSYFPLGPGQRWRMLEPLSRRSVQSGKARRAEVADQFPGCGRMQTLLLEGGQFCDNPRDLATYRIGEVAPPASSLLDGCDEDIGNRSELLEMSVALIPMPL